LPRTAASCACWRPWKPASCAASNNHRARAVTATFAVYPQSHGSHGGKTCNPCWALSLRKISGWEIYWS